MLFSQLNRAIVPAFPRGRSQMWSIKIKDARRCSQDRYTCEAAFARVTNHRILYGVAKFEEFRYMNDAHLVAHFCANMYKPLIKPNTWDNLRSDLEAAPEPRECGYRQID